MDWLIALASRISDLVSQPFSVGRAPSPSARGARRGRRSPAFRGAPRHWRGAAGPSPGSDLAVGPKHRCAAPLGHQRAPPLEPATSIVVVLVVMMVLVPTTMQAAVMRTVVVHLVSVVGGRWRRE